MNAVKTKTMLTMIACLIFCSVAASRLTGQEPALKDPTPVASANDNRARITLPTASTEMGQLQQRLSRMVESNPLENSLREQSLAPQMSEQMTPPTASMPQELPVVVGDESHWNSLYQEMETTRQVEMIGDRIKKLIELNNRKRQRNIYQSPFETASDSTETIENTAEDNQQVGQKDSGVGEVIQGQLESDQTPEILPPLPIDQSKVLESTRILRQPPDQRALADNLFYSGEYELALDLYRSIEGQEKSDENSVWTRYQKAACLRQLNRIDEESVMLRTIAEDAGSDELGTSARWWLETSSRKQDLREELQVFEQFIREKQNVQRANAEPTTRNSDSATN